MPRVGILTGLKREAACLGTLEQSDDPPLVRLSAARAERALAMAHELARADVRGLVSFGFAAGLNAGMRAGTLVLPATVVDAAGALWPVDPAWRAALAECAPEAALVDRALGVDAAQTTPGAKSIMQVQTGAAACDMEGHHLARAACDAGLPFVAIRAIADTCGERVPEWTVHAVGETGALGIAAVAAGIAAHPGDWRTLARLGAASRGASASLRRLVAAAGPGLGFPGL